MSFRILALVSLSCCWQLMPAQETAVADTVAADSVPDETVVVKADDPPQMKRVGLVLGGGGAKGVAHIGVLKVLERAGIPVDLIVGTSMGSIIGATYACGHSAEQLDSVVRQQNWQFVLSDREDLTHQSLYERQKQKTYGYSRSITIGKSDPATTDGGGFIIGKNISALFDQLTYPYLDSIDFNTLPIPFACIATDVAKNEEHVFHSGVLSRAMRASMAIPGVFAPVRIADKVLVDGGLRNNFPADVAREMKADFVIGVDVQDVAKEASELNSATSIISQILDWNCMNKYNENKAITDIVIRVNTEGYSAASFTKAAVDTLIRRGEEAAMAHWDEIVALREKLFLDRFPRSQRQQASKAPQLLKRRIKIGTVRFENMSKSDEAYILRKFDLNPGDSIEAAYAEIVTTSIRQDLYYKTAKARIYNNPDRDDATVIFIAGPKKSNQVNIGLRFDSEEMLALQANVEMPLKTKMPMDLEMTLRLGKRFMAGVDWSLHPISFFRPTVSYTFYNNDIDYYEYGTQAINLVYNRHNVKLSLLNFNVRNFNISIGANFDYYDYHTILVDRAPERQEETSLVDEGLINYETRVWYNSENDWYFPTKGALFDARFKYYTDNFFQYDDDIGIFVWNMLWRKTFPLSSKLSVQPMLCGRFIYGDDFPLLLSNVMGGEWYGHYLEEQLPFAGVNNLEISWNKLAAFQLQTQYNLTTNNHILLRVAAGQDADEVEDMFKHRTMLGVSMSYYYNTMFGPLGGSIGYSNLTKRFYYYINLGFVF